MVGFREHPHGWLLDAGGGMLGPVLLSEAFVRYCWAVNRSRTNAAAFLDAGWLFLLAGIAIIGATVLIPAADDLSYAQWLRDRALAVEQHRLDRLARYEEYLAAIEQRQPALIQSLAASQLNQIPANQAIIPGARVDADADASVFPALEPPALRLPERQIVDSTLQRWTTDDRYRTWLIIGGAGCILIGLLPPSRVGYVRKPGVGPAVGVATGPVSTPDGQADGPKGAAATV